MRILVLCGGESAERVVSLASGDAVANWIAECGHEVAKYDPEHPGRLAGTSVKLAPDAIGTSAPAAARHEGYDPRVARGLLDAFGEFHPDLVFPILHGGRGEDGTLQALLEWVNIPFAGSNSLASAMAMNKERARQVMRAAGVPVAEGFVVSNENLSDVQNVNNGIVSTFGYPIVVKPLHGGSTIGLTKVYGYEDLAGSLNLVRSFGDAALIEVHVSGKEIAAAVIAGEAYPLIEIRPREGFYDYTNKYTSGMTDYVCPAPILDETSREIQKAAVLAFGSLGCSGFARVDFLLNENGRFVCLEVNTLPGMTTNSLVPKAARARGETPMQMIEKIIACAVKRARRV